MELLLTPFPALHGREKRHCRMGTTMVKLDMTRAHSLFIVPVIVPLLAAGLLLLPHGAGAQIVVSGPATPTARLLTSWFTRHIPARFEARGRFEVHPLHDGAMEAYLRGSDDTGSDQNQSSHAGDGEIDGVFEDNPARITLRVPASGQPDLYTFAHEYGHYVWFNLLSRDDKNRYESIYKKQKALHHLVTRYAQTDVEEGFAEAFSFYANEPPLLLHRDALSYQFLSQWPATPPAS